MKAVPPCILFEDDDLLVVNKPAGLNTHAPSPYAGEGLYEWLRQREPRWARLAIIHRLDKETSGVMVFSKTQRANQSLTDQFSRRLVSKTYVLLTDRPGPRAGFTARSTLVRAGERYVSRPMHQGAPPAETRFSLPPPGFAIPVRTGQTALLAEPLTGRTHQIRIHASEAGFPILGDTLYGGTPFDRVCLHAVELTLHHPGTEERVSFRAGVEFSDDPGRGLREALIDPQTTTACRVLHGAADGEPGWYVDRLGDWLLSQSEEPLNATRRQVLERLGARQRTHGAYHKLLNRKVRGTNPAAASPQLVLGPAAPDRFVVLENGLSFELSFSEGYSVGLFLDQRENRRRLLTRHVAEAFELSPGTDFTVLNTFAYTCGFSAAAAKAGAITTSLDLSRKYLDWGRQNFALNGLDPARHDFIYGDAFDWLRRLARKGRTFDVVILDPPTFSQSRESGVFRADRDYARLAAAALPLVKPGGTLLASTNAAEWAPEDFLGTLDKAVRAGGRKTARRHYVPQPPDFPVTRAEPAYLKTAWLGID